MLSRTDFHQQSWWKESLKSGFLYNSCLTEIEKTLFSLFTQSEVAEKQNDHQVPRKGGESSALWEQQSCLKSCVTPTHWLPSALPDCHPLAFHWEERELMQLLCIHLKIRVCSSASVLGNPGHWHSLSCAHGHSNRSGSLPVRGPDKRFPLRYGGCYLCCHAKVSWKTKLS